MESLSKGHCYKNLKSLQLHVKDISSQQMAYVVCACCQSKSIEEFWLVSDHVKVSAVAFKFECNNLHTEIYII